MLKVLLGHMPVDFDAYHEPFLGGGSLFFRLRRRGEIKDAVLSDLNAELIDAYLAVRDCVADVIEVLSGYPYSKEFYYELREKDPWKLGRAERAARMIYLNKTGFNGLYRVDAEGRFSVAFGWYRAPRYLDPENLRAVSQALRGVEIVCAPYDTVLSRAKTGDFVYFDPPYLPTSKTARFVGYTPQGFGFSDHVRLRDVCVELNRRGVRVMLSNCDKEIARSLYELPGFALHGASVSRTIGNKVFKQGRAAELIVVNYGNRRLCRLF